MGGRGTGRPVGQPGTEECACPQGNQCFHHTPTQQLSGL